MKRILLIMAGVSVLLWADFTRDNITGIVTDSSTGLQWQDDINITKRWEEAINYCETLTLGTYTDWRLPNQNELRSIVDRSKVNPSIDTAFKNVVIGWYWSSSTLAARKDEAWNVYFRYGNDSMNNKPTSLHVRCVRDGQ